MLACIADSVKRCGLYSTSIPKYVSALDRDQSEEVDHARVIVVSSRLYSVPSFCNATKWWWFLFPLLRLNLSTARSPTLVVLSEVRQPSAEDRRKSWAQIPVFSRLLCEDTVAFDDWHLKQNLTFSHFYRYLSFMHPKGECCSSCLCETFGWAVSIRTWSNFRSVYSARLNLTSSIFTVAHWIFHA